MPIVGILNMMNSIFMMFDLIHHTCVLYVKYPEYS